MFYNNDSWSRNVRVWKQEIDDYEGGYLRLWSSKGLLLLELRSLKGLSSLRRHIFQTLTPMKMHLALASWIFLKKFSKPPQHYVMISFLTYCVMKTY
uniref:Uncharacterized protein n=1 Tax=Lactuca sativa TaxID=4236 RepID=A0A9R1UPV8_LACSA|nr:hypothetical protein LSAT_V11C800425490 [Lactuca sativa]